MIRNIHDIEELEKLRELAYGMAAHNLNPEDVADYMAIALAAARMESRKRAMKAIEAADNTKEEGNINA